MDDIAKRISEINDKIAKLPAGSIGKKTVKGRTYYYHRWTENGKRKEKYIPAAELGAFEAQIGTRRALQEELRSLAALSVETHANVAKASGVADLREDGYAAYSGSLYRTNVITGRSLELFSAAVRKYKKRGIYKELSDYLYGDYPDKVLVLYGLRRTGKTTMIRQAIADMREEDLNRAAFIQTVPGNTLADMNADLRMLLDGGYRYVFIDEVTLMDDFIQGSALFTDIFAASGMKVVLSGTDSLGFVFAEDEQLYDRCRFIHTTFIPYREFEEVLGIRGVDEYIRFGGTMSISGRNYNEESTFATKTATDEYIDSSIARNIQHSLKHYQYGGHFRALQDLYERDELTGAVNRVVEDINHRFTLDTLAGNFRSHDLALSAANLRRDRNDPTDILDRVDIAEVTGKLARLLEIKDKKDRKAALDDIHALEIKQYLELLEITADIDVVDMEDLNTGKTRSVVAQPGLRYSQADALVASLLQDETFSDISAEERRYVLSRIRSEIRGRMLEELVLLETSKAFPGRKVFTLRFAVGEYDMVVQDPDSLTCAVYEIKHSKEKDPAQIRHLTDEVKCRRTTFRFGTITGRYVLYRGGTDGAAKAGEVRYINVEEYLKELYDRTL